MRDFLSLGSDFMHTTKVSEYLTQKSVHKEIPPSLLSSLPLLHVKKGRERRLSGIFTSQEAQRLMTLF